MTLFNSDDTPVVDPNKNYLEDYVGEGKKFSSPEDLARGKAESDAFIERLKTEAAGLRQELATRLKLEEAVEKINNSQRQTPPSNDPTPDPEKGGASATPEDIKKLIAETLQEATTKSLRERNLETVEKTLQDAFGPTYQRTIKERAQKLGLGETFLQNLAAEQPQAFLKLLDVSVTPEVPSTAVTAPRSNVSAEAFHGFKPASSQKTMSHFEKIRKADPSRYWSPAVQNEMHREAQRLGEAFFDV